MNAVELQTPPEGLLRELLAQGKFQGITPSLSNEEYHKAPGLNFSALKAFSITPADYQAYLRKQKAPTEDQRVGTLVHMLGLEPELADKQIKCVEGTWAHKIKAEVEKLRAEGFLVVKPAELELAKRMAGAILKNQLAKKLLTGGVAEHSIFWKDEATGLTMKCRPDYMLPDKGILVDLKWFNKLDQRNIESHIFRSLYHWQAAHYLDGASSALGKPVTKFVHIFVQEQDPFNVRVIALNEAALDKARHDYQPLIEQFKECLTTNTWPGYPEQIAEMTIPNYAWGDQYV